MVAKGGIRRQEIPFLTQYGTPYALYDEQDDGYIHALKSEEYRFGGYVDLRVEVARPVIDVGREVPLDEHYQGPNTTWPVMRPTRIRCKAWRT
jgi:hypothetical protein